MRAFNGKSRIWIWLLRLLIISALLACAILAYHHYMFGNIKVNRQYITNENLDLIVKNREKLIQSGLFDPWDGKVYFDMALVNLWQFEKMIYHCPENTILIRMCLMIQLLELLMKETVSHPSFINLAGVKIAPRAFGLTTGSALYMQNF